MLFSAQAFGWPRDIARDGTPMQHMADIRLLACRLGPRPNAETATSGEKLRASGEQLSNGEQLSWLQLESAICHA